MPSQVPAIDRAIQVLYLFKDGEKAEYGVSEISRLLNLNKSTVHNILNTLARHNFLTQNEATRRYRLGYALAELGSMVRSQIDLRTAARPHLRSLMEQTDSTILLGIFNGAIITIVDKEEPLAAVRVAASIGMQLPFCAGSFGQAFMAFQPEERVNKLLDKPGLKAFTASSITGKRAYRARLAQVKTQGYAIDNHEEYLLDVGAISVPIFGPITTGAGQKSHVAGVITLVNFNSRLTPDKIARFTPLMVSAGQEISAQLGGVVSR